MIRRPPRSTLDRSSAASDVYKRQVATWAPDHAVASAARWLVALYGLCGGAVFIFFSPLHDLAQRIPGLAWGKLRRTAYYCTAWQPLAFAGFFILVLTVSAVVQQVNGVK